MIEREGGTIEDRTSKRLRGGTNTEVIKHSVFFKGDDDHPFEFVEKICPKYKHREVLALAAWQGEDRNPAVTPVFLGCSLLSEERLSVLMEYLPGARTLTLERLLGDKVLLKAVGRGIGKLASQVGASDFQAFGLQRGWLPRVDDLSGLVRDVVSGSDGKMKPDFLDALQLRRWMIDRAGELPLVPSSNDVSASNISFQGSRAEQVVFFDLEKAGLSPVGADLWRILSKIYLHHKDSEELGQRQAARLVRAYRKEIRSVFPDLDMQDVLIGANVCGLIGSLKALRSAYAADNAALIERETGNVLAFDQAIMRI